MVAGAEGVPILLFAELEWMLSTTGGIKTDLERNPRKGVTDVLMSSLGAKNSSRFSDSEEDEDDW